MNRQGGLPGRRPAWHLGVALALVLLGAVAALHADGPHAASHRHCGACHLYESGIAPIPASGIVLVLPEPSLHLENPRELLPPRDDSSHSESLRAPPARNSD